MSEQSSSNSAAAALGAVERFPTAGHFRLLTVVAFLMLVAPYLPKPDMETIFVGLFVAVPYGIVVYRTFRSHTLKAAAAMAIGASWIVAAGATMLLLSMRFLDSLLQDGVLLAIAAIHTCWLVTAILLFRRTTSEKPAWRLLVRGVAEPLLLFGFMLGLGLAAHGH